MHLTPEDLQALKEIFATKDDLTAREEKFVTKADLAALGQALDKKLDQHKIDLSRLQTAMDKRFDQQDAQFKRELEAQKTALLDSIRSYLENNLTPFILDHEQRLKRIEDQLDLSPIPASS